MPDATDDDLLADFTPARPYTMEAAAGAPEAPGVHVVIDGGTVVYVGYTENLRNRLRQHLTGNRGSSVLHDQVGQELDRPDHEAPAAEITTRLGRYDVRWQEIDNPKSTKDVLVLAFRPKHNRQIPKPR
ncbi:GIY-YIG nuclease family protein [Micromonospora fluostatini]|uniref:GIY-YIG nuclease family protein n=1 Tax=Micromonospora fluostatini TaxID=1629071 RepID=A0ABY2DMI8_9ACTN|nr:GIY-YIG nuclease family protein [Micromonospora fluostatini]